MSEFQSGGTYYEEVTELGRDCIRRRCAAVGRARGVYYDWSVLKGWHYDQRSKLLMSIDRSEVARALAKAIAYKNCGNDELANEWARKLVVLLECAEVLK